MAQGEVIVVTSGKGGVGKTTASANIASGLAKLDKKVVAIDTDIGLRNLDVVMGLENRIVYNLVDVVEGNCRLKQALIRDKHLPGLFLLPSAQTRDKSSVNPEQMAKLMEELRCDYDYIILDCPAGIEQGFFNAVLPADRAIVVTTPAYEFLIDQYGVELLVNRIRMDLIRKGDMMNVEDVLELLGVPLIGVVPDDESVVISANQGEPLAGGDTIPGQAYFNICRRIIGEDVAFLDLKPRGFLRFFHRKK